MKTNISDLKTKGMVALTYPKILRAQVKDTITAWKAFCDLSRETKENLPYSSGGAGVGYEIKDGIGKNADRKENFDVTLSGLDWFSENLANIEDGVAIDFLQKAVGLIPSIKPLILGFAGEAEKAFGLDGFADEVARSEDTFFVRFIHYFGDRETGEETASAHADQSGFTLHLFETGSGLQSLAYESGWRDMPVSMGETVIIPAMQIQLRSKGELRATTHRVVATPETVSEGRYSAVCFVQLRDTPKYNKAIHGRLQEKKPGFNYLLPHREFEKLFL